MENQMNAPSFLRRRVAIAGAVALLLGLGSIAHADTVTVTESITGVGSTLTDWNNTISFAQFDGSLGTLVKATISLHSSVTTDITITNNALSGYAKGNAFNELQVWVNGDNSTAWLPSIMVVDTYPPQLSQIYSINGLNGGLGLAGGQTASSGNFSYVGTGSHDYTSADTVMSNFVGGGTISLPAGTLIYDWSGLSGGNNQVTDVTSADVSGTVTYEYITGAPLPGVAPAGLAGLMLVTGMRVFRRRVAK